MKITKTQLKQIIQEELRRTLKEGRLADLEDTIRMHASDIEDRKSKDKPVEVAKRYIEEAIDEVRMGLSRILEGDDFKEALKAVMADYLAEEPSEESSKE